VYAIIETGGKQYTVREGDTVDVELLNGEADTTVELDRVLMVAGGDGVQVGTPTVEGAVVQATVVDEVKGDKVVVFKYKPKIRYRCKTGHRQHYTRLLIDRIIVPGAPKPEEEPITVTEAVPVAGVSETVEAVGAAESWFLDSSSGGEIDGT
jgi:large subunit ribosomal protein L21